MVVANIRLNSVKITPITRTMVVTLEGEVESLKPTLRGMQLLLQENKSDANRDFNKVRLNISDKLSSDLVPGDIVRLKAKLFPLQSSVLPGSYDFGFYMYMSGIEATGYALTAPEVISSNPSAFSKYIKLKRGQIYKRLVEVLGAANGNFASAILIGETKAIPKDISENMRNSGVAHILSRHLSKIIL
jgi:competence protein ComEC